MGTDEALRDTVVLRDPEGVIFEVEVSAGDGPRVQEKLDILVRAFEQEPALRGQLAAMREALKYMRDHAPLREQSQNGPYSQEDCHWRCMRCEGRTVDYLNRYPEHEEWCPYTVVMQALSSDFGKPGADVIAGAVEGRQTCRTQDNEDEEEPCCTMCLWERCCQAVERMEKGKSV